MKSTQFLSFNLRVNVLNDGMHSWEYRKVHVLTYLRAKQFDVMGFQEATPEMFKQLKHALRDYDSYGIGRDKNGEATPIFVKKGLFEVVETSTFWLSATPNVESKVHGSHFARVATYVVLRTEDQEMIAYFNTHLDYAFDTVSIEQAEYLLEFIRSIEEKYQCAVLLSGDFNQLPASQTIRYVSRNMNSVYTNKKNIQLTHHGFTRQEKGEPIDYFFYNDQVVMEEFNVVHHDKDGYFLSDHYPILARVNIKKI